jgi:hypothetical protein
MRDSTSVQGLLKGGRKVNSESSCREYVKSCLRSVSFGQYRTPLYYKGSDNYSNAFGGLCSLLCIILIGVFAAGSLYPVVRKETYNLVSYQNKISAYMVDPNYNYMLKSYCSDCVVTTMREALEMYLNDTEFYVIPPKEMESTFNCTGLQLNLWFKNFPNSTWSQVVSNTAWA